MRNAIVLMVLALVALGVAVSSSPDRANAAFHLMRVYGVGGGAFGDSDIQWVELRMVNPGQSLVNTHDICFFDAAGDPYARFTFPSNVGNGADEASILIGSEEQPGPPPTASFDTAWEAGSPDFVFSTANTVALGGGATAEHPVPTGSGKVAFGSDSATMPAMMCAGSFSVIDSIAYGTGYTGDVDFGTMPFGSDLPTADTQVLRLQGPICIPGGTPTCDPPRNNAGDDYMLVDANTAENYPRNNGNVSGPLSSAPDSDSDGVPDNTDNCPSWPNPGQELPAWTVPPDDPDCDGFNTTDEGIIGTDPDSACGASAWPPDFDDTTVINTTDVFQLLPPTFGTTVPPTPVRRDIAPSGVINTTDVFRVLPPVLGSGCSP